MTAYVDELRPATRGPRIRNTPRVWCHLMADTEEELHAFAQRIGMQRKWFQPGRYPHYDLTPGRRLVAVRYGAVEVTARDLVRLRRAPLPHA